MFYSSGNFGENANHKTYEIVSDAFGVLHSLNHSYIRASTHTHIRRCADTPFIYAHILQHRAKCICNENENENFPIPANYFHLLYSAFDFSVTSTLPLCLYSLFFLFCFKPKKNNFLFILRSQ